MQEANVDFPICGPEPRMNRVKVIAYPNRHNGMRSCASDKKLPQIKRLLSYCRDGEGIESLDTDVVIRFDDDDFEGQSFGLALALADKLARFTGGSSPDAMLCATGIIANKGKISAVNRFADKVALATKSLRNGSVFVFPHGNRADDEAGLERMVALGIDTIGATDLSDLVHLWEPCPVTPGPGPTSRWKPRAEFTLGLGLGLVLPVLIAFAYVSISGL